MENIAILGAGRFIETNLVLYILSKNVHLTLVNKKTYSFENIYKCN